MKRINPIFNDGGAGTAPGAVISLLASFPLEWEITALAASRLPYDPIVYIAFKDQGIRKFRFSWKPGDEFREEPAFFANSHRAIESDVVAMVSGSAVNAEALYATDGGDTIYRFSTEGIPDYPVK